MRDISIKRALSVLAIAGAVASFGVMFNASDARARACDPDTGRCYGPDESPGPRPAYMATPKASPRMKPSIARRPARPTREAAPLAYGKGMAPEEDPVVDLINIPRPEDASRAPEGGSGWIAFGASSPECIDVWGCGGGDGGGGNSGGGGGGGDGGGGGNGNGGGGNDSGGNGNAGAGGGDGGGGPAF